MAADRPAQSTVRQTGRQLREVWVDPRFKLAAGAMAFSQLAMVIVMTVKGTCEDTS
jgi:hypothetical protein